MDCHQMADMDRPSVLHSHSDPMRTATDPKFRDPPRFEDGWKTNFSETTHSVPLRCDIRPHSFSATFPRPSSPSERAIPSRRSISSSLTSTAVSVDLYSDFKSHDGHSFTKGSSLFSRLCSSTSDPVAARPPFLLSDFRKPPDQPEKHFIDSIGMVIPGACDRNQCHSLEAHLVFNWPLCEPIEYSTNLADHGITHQDYALLLNALARFLDRTPSEPKTQRCAAQRWRGPRQKQSCGHRGSDEGEWRMALYEKRPSIDSKMQEQILKYQSQELDKLLDEITCAWQERNVPVLLCISSCSLVGSSCVSESHVQVLHVPLEHESQPKPPKDLRNATQLTFTDSFARTDLGQHKVACPSFNTRRGSLSPHSDLIDGSQRRHFQNLQLRDRTQPWSLWPNAIPSQKREQMSTHVDRYGVDPYFRAWMRANINSRTRCMSYAKYMIETENDPFINKRMNYVTSPQQRSPLLKRLGICAREKSIGCANRELYEHNRRLECRKTIENGGRRLRLLRFGFRQAIYPPHTPEMTRLGLTQNIYDNILNNIDTIRDSIRSNYFECVPIFFKSWNKIRCRTMNDASKEVHEYVRELNTADRRIVWTIEKIPGLHDPESHRDGDEWEISAWNGDDPLDLVIELEKWGIVEKKLSIEDDE